MSTRDALISTRDALIEDILAWVPPPSRHAFIARERLAAQSDDDLKATHSRLKRLEEWAQQELAEMPPEPSKSVGSKLPSSMKTILLMKLADAYRAIGKVPTDADLRIYGHPDFPRRAIIGRFGATANIQRRLSESANANSGYEDVAEMLADYAFRGRASQRPEVRVSDTMGYALQDWAQRPVVDFDSAESNSQ
jgi:hypothetical protein